MLIKLLVQQADLKVLKKTHSLGSLIIALALLRHGQKNKKTTKSLPSYIFLTEPKGERIDVEMYQELEQD